MTESQTQALLLWIAEAFRSYSLAPPLTPAIQDALKELAAKRSGWSWALVQCHSEIPLDYEPRALAVAADGRGIAVGTKAGTIVIVRREGASWVPGQPLQIEEDARPHRGAQPEEIGRKIRRGIRALAFLDGDTLLAGMGAGGLAVIRQRDQTWSWQLLSVDESPQPGTAPDRRLRHIVVLPGTGKELRALAFAARADPIAVAIDASATGGLRAQRTTTKDALASILRGTESPDATCDRVVRIIDAAADACSPSGTKSSTPVITAQPSPKALWLLVEVGGSDSGIALVHCVPGVAPRVIDVQGPTAQQALTARRIKTCVAGLLIAGVREVGFVTSSALATSESRVAPEWFRGFEMLDCTAAVPFQDPDPKTSVLIATGDSGLHWIRLKADGSPSSDVTFWSRVEPDESRPDHTLLLDLFDSEGCIHLVRATVNHRLIVQSLSNRSHLDKYIEEEASGLLSQKVDDQRDITPAETMTSEGLAYWALGKLCKEEFHHFFRSDAAPIVPADGNSGPARVIARKRDTIWGCFDQLAAGDLRKLLLRALQLLLGSDSPTPSSACPYRAPSDSVLSPSAAWFMEWAQLILSRAYDISAKLGREIACTVHDVLSTRSRSSGDASFRLLSEFFHKWFVQGRTYGAKRRRLLELVRHNLDCGRNLDSLAYLAPLLRRRIDLLDEWSYPRTEYSVDLWDLITAADGSACASYANGDLRFFASDLRPLGITMSAQVKNSAEEHHFLDAAAACGSGVLRHKQAQAFFQEHHHGPYARSLALQQPSKEMWLLVFALKTSPSGVPKDYSARLYALLLTSRDQINILAIDSKPLDTDLYRLVFPASATQPTFRLMAGTSGVWRSSPAGEREEWVRCPFVEFDIAVDSQGPSVEIKPRMPSFEFGETAQRHRSVRKSAPIDPRTDHNPTWGLASIITGAQLWTLVGSEDGQFRCFRWDNGKWVAGDRLLCRNAESSHSPAQTLRLDLSTLSQGSPVWQLALVRTEELDPYTQEPQRALLVYGTAAGVVGAIWLPTTRWEFDSSPAGASFVWDSHVRLATHTVHTKMESSVVGLRAIRDLDQRRSEVPGGSPETNYHALAVITWEGVVHLYHIDPRFKTRGSLRSTFDGHRVDRFRIGHGVRRFHVGLSAVEGHFLDVGRSVPTLLFGCEGGHIRRYALYLPNRSQRRKDAAGVWIKTEWEESAPQGALLAATTTPDLRDIVGESARHAWIRILDTATDHLFRFSLWHELHTAVEQLNARQDRGPLPNENFRPFLTRLDELAHRAYARHYLQRQSAKVVWEEGSKVANKLARRALESREVAVRDGLLSQAFELYRKIDRFCNRWIGAAQADESRVLAHSFRSLLDPVVLALLAIPVENESGPLRDLREFVINTLIRRRISYTRDAMVPLESLRILNTSLLRILLQAGEGDRSFVLRRRETTNPCPGYYDVMVLVGDLADAHFDRLAAGDPLATELSRFFGLSLVLVPQSALVIGQVISESRLLERSGDVVWEVVSHAKRAHEHLTANERTGGMEDVEKGIRRFVLYMIARPGGPKTAPCDSLSSPESAWGELKRTVAEIGAQSHCEPLTDVELSREFLHVIEIVDAMRNVESDFLGRVSNAALDWLQKGDPCRYFAHSRAYITKLQERHKAIVGQLQQPREVAAALKQATADCTQALEELRRERALFEPQRKQYESLIQAWQQQIDRRHQEAAEIIELLHVFNRHVHQAKANRQMGYVTELALQFAPLWYPEKADRPVRVAFAEALEKRSPLVRRLFEETCDVLDSVHLAGTLMGVAQQAFRPGSAFGSSVPDCACSQVQEDLEAQAKDRRLDIKPTFRRIG